MEESVFSLWLQRDTVHHGGEDMAADREVAMAGAGGHVTSIRGK